MNKEQLLNEWLKEEKVAHIKGWDFSHLQDRYVEEDQLPWDFYTVIKKYLTNDMQLLDMETGGGEFLLSLNHPKNMTSAIEGYKPNVDYCRKVLLPLGVDFKEADGEEVLPFPNQKFDIITNRHGNYNVSELRRLLKNNGLFMTQQVGAENDRELVELLLSKNIELPFPNQYLKIKEKELRDNHFEIIESGEVFQPIKFYDVGALVWFARIIEWEFVGFSVESCLENLYNAQRILEEKGVIEGKIHRFYIVARKKD
ncbi:MAG: methyltransferase domain-containing protein [Coprobacillus cateniformis]|uniref:class I SAM-dependent methyltransferase n=1 Tax=Longibaculum muris TaxID=1796628 RepID=UPI003AB55B6E|nr:methyltransferase domain-containing protein [Coprobacillus cateniformis]